MIFKVIFPIIFILLLIYILLTVNNTTTTLQDTLWTHCKNSFAERVWGSSLNYYNQMESSKLIRGGFIKNKPFNIQEIHIIDVANLAGNEMFPGLPKLGQNDRMIFYIKIIEKYHLKNKKTLNIYVIKNYKNLKDNCTMAPPISKRIWKRLKKLCQNPQIRIALAEDYKNYSRKIWTNSRNHYLRARDDYLCFYIAQNYKKKYTKAIIISNDKFKDFSQFQKIPTFKATYIWKDGDIKTLTEKINAQRKRLGQYVDYNTETFLS